MQAPPFLCSICETPKLDTNHWLFAIVKPGFEGILFQPIEATDPDRNPLFTYEEICGQSCCHKRLSRYLDDLNETFKSLQKQEVETHDTATI